MELDEILDCYFDYLVKVIIDAIYNADAYDCRDFNALKLELIVNISKIFSSRENYNKVIEVLREDEKRCR